MSEHRDRHVADALGRLDVPDHGPNFWADLEARLADDDLVGGGHSDTDPADRDAEVVDLGAFRETGSRRSARSLRLPAVAAGAAAAAALALGVGLPAIQQAADGDAQLDTATVPQDEDPAPTTPGPTDPVITEPAPGASVQQAEDAAQDWLETLFAGDVEGAYERLDETSRSLMSFADFELLGSGLFEGAAAFAQDGIERTVAAIPAAGEPFHVVTFSGEVEREGMIEMASYPVILTSSGVHFTLEGPEVELDPDYAQSSGTTLAAPLEVVVSDTADTWLWVDGAEPERFLSGGRLVMGEEALGGAGTHAVNVVAIEGGRITARAWTVVVP